MSERRPHHGVLGAGQLSLMLVEAAHQMNLRVRVFASEAKEPALDQADDSFIGSLAETHQVEKFLQGLQSVAYESDFLDFKKLKTLDTKALIPDVSVIEKISDKVFQKTILTELNIPHPRHELLSPTKKDYGLPSIQQKLGGDLVLKWGRGGYDGKGVFIGLKDPQKLKDFCALGFSRGYEIFAEPKINFKREISLVCVLSKSNEWDAYPLVISEQQNGICRRVWGPAKNFGVSVELETSARAAAEKVGKRLGLYGTYAIEMFEDESGGFLVNEIAPRVHNTGHFSLSACEKSQFENHWRALRSQRPEGLKTNENFLMLNILGVAGGSISETPNADVDELDELSGLKTDFKWYQKREMKLGRKMGHINVTGFDAGQLQPIFSAMEKWESNWLKRF